MSRSGSTFVAPLVSSFTRFKPSAVATVAALLALGACGGGSGGSDNAASSVVRTALQGGWSADCRSVNDELSSRRFLDIEGLEATQSALFYVGNNECSGDLIFSIVSGTSFAFPAGTTDTSTGLAQHLNITFNDTVANSTPALDARLALEGSSFEALMQENFGITDTANVGADVLGLVSPLFTLVRVDDDGLQLGDNESNQGIDEETRLTELSQDASNIFSRQ